MYTEPLVIKRTLNCSKRQLFDAWSKAELISKWFFASASKVRDSLVESQFHVGGHWSVTMYFEDGGDTTLSGQYKDIIRYSNISFTWNSSIATNGLVELEFKELSPNRSSLKLVHSQLVSEESKSKHNHGWHACLSNLEKFAEQQVELN